MAMERWDPFRDIVSLRDAMDRLIQDSFVRPAGSLLQGSRGGVPLDVVEKDNSYQVHASLPGSSQRMCRSPCRATQSPFAARPGASKNAG